MGWKSTKYITKQEAVNALNLAVSRAIMSGANSDLANMMENIGIGDDLDLPFYGYNFIVLDSEEEVKHKEGYDMDSEF